MIRSQPRGSGAPTAVDGLAFASELQSAVAATEHRRATAELLKRSAQPFDRTCYSPGHIVASAFVTHVDRRHILLIRHRRLGRWLQPGGHLETGDASVRHAAARELAEETGLVVRADAGVLCDVDVHPIASGREPEHLHHDVRFHWIAFGSVRGDDDADDAAWVDLHHLAGRIDGSIDRMVAWAMRHGHLVTSLP